jgi:putative spermidine/putrescine transport system ATP-binding protein
MLATCYYPQFVRVAITEPRVLLLDEPLSALDEQLRVRMRVELQRMQRELGITFVHVTHSQLEAIALADMVVVMNRGQIMQAGPARDVYATPKDRYVAEFLGGQNVFSGRVNAVSGDCVTLAFPHMKAVAVPMGDSRVSQGDTVDVAVRRDDIDLVRPGRDLTTDKSSLASRVLAVEYQGNFVKVMLDATGTDEFVAYVHERTFFRDPYIIGDVVMAAWPTRLGRLLSKTQRLSA